MTLTATCTCGTIILVKLPKQRAEQQGGKYILVGPLKIHSKIKEFTITFHSAHANLLKRLYTGSKCLTVQVTTMTLYAPLAISTIHLLHL